jgi:hypothetical protein
VADKHIEGTRTIVSSSFALFGTMPVPADRPSKTPEQFEEERAADRVRYSVLLAELHWTPADLDHAQAFNFPAAIGRTFTGHWASETTYSRRAIAEWRTAIKRLAAML